MPENEQAAPADEAPQEAAQPSEAKAEATSTASTELSEDDLEAVAGGAGRGARPTEPPRATNDAGAPPSGPGLVG